MRGVSASIVITGLGCVTPLGPDLPTTWRRLMAGETAQQPVTLFDVAGSRCQKAAPAALPDTAAPRRLTRGSRLALPAAREALAQAGLLNDAGRSVVTWLPMSVSTTAGGMTLGEQFLRDLVAGRRQRHRYYRVAHYPAQRQALDMQRHLGFRGPITIIANACASGANAIGHARDLIRSGEVEMVLAGGYEPLTELIYYGFDCLQALSPDCCRPFDRGRTGLMLGEAAAFLVLETEARARARGATILAALTGYGHSTDLHHLTQPGPAGSALIEAARMALGEAGVMPGYLNAHGTATPANDGTEAGALAAIFARPEEVAPGRALPQTTLPQTALSQNEAGLPRISSTKAAIGHTLGAAGAIEAVFAIQALRTGELPPQLNLRDPEPAVAGRLVRRGERAADLSATMSVNLGFGGSNAALVFGRVVGAPFRARPEEIAPPRALPQLAVAGTGAVWPADTEPTQSLGGLVHPVYRVNLKQERLARWQTQPRLRRASPISLFMVEAARQALDTAGPVDMARIGIVVAYGTGAVVLTRRFYEGVIKSGPRFASPNLFPETVFNSPTSHLAAMLGASGPCYSLIGDEAGWVTAIHVAATWLVNDTVEHALVIGAEEFDPVLLDAYASVRWLRDGFVPAEGAGALLLRRPRPGERPQITGWRDGFTFQNRQEARAAARELMAAVRPAPHPDPLPIGWGEGNQDQIPSPHSRGEGQGEGFVRTACRNWFAAIERELLPAAPELPYCGDAFAASAAWNTIQALRLARPVVQPVWGLTGQCSALLLAGG